MRLTRRVGTDGSRSSIGTRASIVVLTMIVTIAAMDITVFGTDTGQGVEEWRRISPLAKQGIVESPM